MQREESAVNATNQTPAPNRRRVAAVCGLAALAVALGGIWLTTGGDDGGRTTTVAGGRSTDEPSEPSESSKTPPPPHPGVDQAARGGDEEPTDSPFDDALDAVYSQCVTSAGFDPGGVQVILWRHDPERPPGGPTPREGQASGVKTGRDVPAEIHRPCFTEIGGDDPHTSSWGEP